MPSGRAAPAADPPAESDTEEEREEEEELSAQTPTKEDRDAGVQLRGTTQSKGFVF